ncbi:MAG: hypothetical protein AMJ64_11125 [Betaproteobacteria bacterium SG8_39]|nr:MAG: hypothetical protein AMJ64_11125 [Betaproteobacteria bacterium SG8_39]
MLRARVGLAGSVAFSLLLLATAGGVARSDSSSASHGPRYEYIYGAELMSAQERDAYRRELSRAQTEPERKQIRERQRKRLHRRAREREVTLDDAGVVQQRGRRQ